MNITILGCGAYGLALSSIFKDNNCNVTMWTKFQEEAQLLLNERCNDKVLAGYKLDKNINISCNMKEAINNANIIVIAIPVKFVRDTIIELKSYIKKSQHICIASKGIEQDSLLFVSNIITKYIKTKKIAVISGGTFAVDIVNKIPLGLTLASKNKASLNIIRKAFVNDYVNIETSKDIYGVSMYGAIKNVIAIASGMIDGMNYPETTKCMFITRSLNDVMNLIYNLGGNKGSILTYAGIGDLLLTCNSTKSRNYTLGYMIGSKIKKDEIDEYKSNTTIEGLYTLKSIYDLLQEKNANIKIITILYNIIYKNEDISLLIKYLK